MSFAAEEMAAQTDGALLLWIDQAFDRRGINVGPPLRFDAVVIDPRAGATQLAIALECIKADQPFGFAQLAIELPFADIAIPVTFFAIGDPNRRVTTMTVLDESLQRKDTPFVRFYVVTERACIQASVPPKPSRRLIDLGHSLFLLNLLEDRSRLPMRQPFGLALFDLPRVGLILKTDCGGAKG